MSQIESLRAAARTSSIPELTDALNGWADTLEEYEKLAAWFGVPREQLRDYLTGRRTISNVTVTFTEP